MKFDVNTQANTMVQSLGLRTAQKVANRQVAKLKETVDDIQNPHQDLPYWLKMRQSCYPMKVLTVLFGEQSVAARNWCSTCSVDCGMVRSWKVPTIASWAVTMVFPPRQMLRSFAAVVTDCSDLIFPLRRRLA